ncbi:ATP-dependent DNA helicase Q-like SIM isoform X2 [Nymphaea colorata]|uniref:ATP-dependent DNA helicase Q-like SIM isoform X2 n=1 Tax=Nymphaea colorata TaxID=210225 RepID=UPI00129E3041|nr:ATP-dependent DNA helicase Q-like SIM isoform X2 [Nymphaea colorata]
MGDRSEDESADHVLAQLVEMGFDLQSAIDAIEAVGPRLDDALDRILMASPSSIPIANNIDPYPSIPVIHDDIHQEKDSVSRLHGPTTERPSPEAKLPPPSSSSPRCSEECEALESNWEARANVILRRHFGIPALKGFQKQALQAWVDNRDCLVLAATGSGKSLCFQLPALLTSKVVVVISPLISLMHDQCLKLSRHGISACFLGSGQTDTSVERKALNGMYSIIYICPETVLRLIEPLRRLAERRGIALFAVDEVHCVSKWGHDFRPDYRRLSALRDNFRSHCLSSLKYDIPLMALTATATINVRKDIINSLCMSLETRVVLTSFFRPNLRFSVRHSRTSNLSSYEKDFHDLIGNYSSQRTGRNPGKKESCIVNLQKIRNLSENPIENSNRSDDANDGDNDDDGERSLTYSYSDAEPDGSEHEVSSSNDASLDDSREEQMSVEYLEDDLDIHNRVNCMDVCGEFGAHSTAGSETSRLHEESEVHDPIELDKGPTIIYVPTRKETIKLAAYLSHSGVKAAAYHAKLPKKHLRNVHEGFHQGNLKVVVATVAFGMGIDKSNVRRIIHYGWPQSLEAYYQEAGRAGRDGKLADCTLYADLSRIPTLLPSKRDVEQTKHSTKMLSDCYRYGMSASCCRAKMLVKYFGEDLIGDGCHLCDICVDGPPKLQDFGKEAKIFLQSLTPCSDSWDGRSPMHRSSFSCDMRKHKLGEKPNMRMVIARINEQEELPKDQLWWRGLARILEDKGYVQEGDDVVHVSIKCPELTALGLQFAHMKMETTLYAYPEADMLLAMRTRLCISSASDWGRGWADPLIRQQRLGQKRKRRQRRHQRKQHQELRTSRGRIAAKLFKNSH